MVTLDELMELQTLNECAYECTRQSRWKETTQRYLSNLLVNNVMLRDEVLSGRYSVQPTTDFTINERGHIRKIEAPAIRDRVVQKTLMKHVLTPSIRPYVIYDNYASLKERGTSFARKRFEVMLRRYIARNGTDGYVLLGDVRKYFESVDHDTLKKMIAGRIAGEPQDVIDLIYYIIDTSSKNGRGLNLGSECPQIFAVYYLNVLDVFIKVVKSVRYYGRYMDDFFVIGKTKAELNSILSEAVLKLKELGLDINRKKTHIVKLSHGFTFLQVKYNILPSGKILKRPSHGKIFRERRRLRGFRHQVDEKAMTENDVFGCYKSWKGAVIKDHNACRKSVSSMDKLYASLFPPHEEIAKEGRKHLIESAFKDAEREDLYYCLKFNH